MKNIDKKIIFLGGLFPENIYNNIIENSIGNVQYAADALQKALVCGMAGMFESLELVNLPYVGSYPKRYRTFNMPSNEFDISTPHGKVYGKNYKFCNFSGVKVLSRYLNTKKALYNSLVSDNAVIVIYAIHTPFLKASIDLKKQFPKVKIVLIVPDLPEFMSSNLSVIRRIYARVNECLLRKLYRGVDGYVLLSEHMKDKLPVGDIPYTVVEGIYNNFKENYYKLPSKEKYILYTGTLAKRYGVMRLVEAFMRLQDTNIKLFICGEGDAKNDIIKYSKSDPRIVYKGLLKREEALFFQQNALLLVNPRTPEGEFTKYSFPSKTMEYLASGVPTLLYQLPGIPSEYYEYCYSLSDLSIEALTMALDNIIHTEPEQLENLGIRARTFILENKSPEKQASKIAELINRCSN